ncbi:MAG: flagellar motor protein MotA [Alphaproteobacteria bacterium]|nr:flagellar motor protein MotA [Alphaproteobacteria bacterium]
MSYPTRYLIWMILCVLCGILLCIILSSQLQHIFKYNPVLNGFIITVFIAGVFYIFYQVISLKRDIAWVLAFKRGDHNLSTRLSPSLLAPLAAMIGEKKGRLQLTPIGLRSLLDGIASRLEESHDIGRYLISLMVFLGLLGTFWGLLSTIGAVSETINNLQIDGDDTATIFAQLKNGLAAPLGGMGTAFSSSMLGLSGSLILGFLELQSNQAHNRFMHELEEWFASQTELLTVGPKFHIHDPSTIPDAFPSNIPQFTENYLHTIHNLKAHEDLLTKLSEEQIIIKESLQKLLNETQKSSKEAN